MFWLALLLLAGIAAQRLWAILPYRRRRRGIWDPKKELKQSELEQQVRERAPKGVKTMVVLGSGGHTSEMLHLVATLSSSVYHPLCYVVAQTDHTSIARIPTDREFTVKVIPRSREVGQSWSSTVWTTLVALFSSARLVFQERPDLLLVNGPGRRNLLQVTVPLISLADLLPSFLFLHPGTCIPIAFWFLLLKASCLKRGRLIFCESFCRVLTLSMTGQLLYYFADRFIVHWPELLEKFAYVEYIGQLG
ncbi:unnamed protein product [Chrysoparadoxa australica]